MKSFKEKFEDYINDFQNFDLQTKEKLKRDVIKIYDETDIAKSKIIAFDDIAVDEGAMTFRVRDKEVLNLKPKEFRLAAFLIKNRNLVFDRDKLLRYVWGDDVYVNDRTVDVHMHNIRKKLGKQGFKNVAEKFITVSGQGYRFLQHK